MEEKKKKIVCKECKKLVVEGGFNSLPRKCFFCGGTSFEVLLSKEEKEREFLRKLDGEGKLLDYLINESKGGGFV
jgi:hypothetical protein